MPLQVITVCAEEYRYNFLIDCEAYKDSVKLGDELLNELINYASVEDKQIKQVND